MCSGAIDNWQRPACLWRFFIATCAVWCSLFLSPILIAAEQASQVPNMFDSHGAPADSILRVSYFAMTITGLIFVFVWSLLVYVIIKYRDRVRNDGSEPAQVSGSARIELAWTVIPILIVVVLFLATFRVILSIQGAEPPPNAVQVTTIGHQFWWEFRYPELGVVTANELHIPVSDQARATPSFLRLLSADTDHTFWVPQLAGKTDLIPNRINSMWIEPHAIGMYVGQCSMFCGVQHANMLLRVYVQSAEDFNSWVAEQKQPANTPDTVAAGRRVFEQTACVNCHTIVGTIADGRFGPDLTHLMSRDTIAAGMVPNTPENLKEWVTDPQQIKPGCLMPDMQLDQRDLNDLVAYLETLK
jgi:cytochrome c oxidase subunit II